jgi:hypothetical protein
MSSTSSIDQTTIDRAILGDPEAALECTNAGVLLPCPVCLGEFCDIPKLNEQNSGLEPFEVSSDCYCACGDTTRSATYNWNYRPDLREVAKRVCAPRWIPCAERLPEAMKGFGQSEQVLVYSEQYLRGSAVAFLDYDKWKPDHWIVWGCASAHLKDITHWMPMPEPPKEDAK